MLVVCTRVHRTAVHKLISDSNTKRTQTLAQRKHHYDYGCIEKYEQHFNSIHTSEHRHIVAYVAAYNCYSPHNSDSCQFHCCIFPIEIGEVVNFFVKRIQVNVSLCYLKIIIGARNFYGRTCSDIKMCHFL